MSQLVVVMLVVVVHQGSSDVGNDGGGGDIDGWGGRTVKGRWTMMGNGGSDGVVVLTL